MRKGERGRREGRETDREGGEGRKIERNEEVREGEAYTCTVHHDY